MKVLIIMTICFVACRSPKHLVDPRQKEYIIRPGKGTNHLNVGKSKITDAFSLLGNNADLKEKIIDRMDSAWVVYSYIYRTLGITAISSAIDEHKGQNLDSSIIKSIYFTAPAKAKTSNGIFLNKSTIEEVKTVFGKADNQNEYADVTILHYRKKGISFIIDRWTNSVAGIEVYEENGYSNHL